jgi:hypothetical protein
MLTSWVSPSVEMPHRRSPGTGCSLAGHLPRSRGAWAERSTHGARFWPGWPIEIHRVFDEDCTWRIGRRAGSGGLFDKPFVRSERLDGRCVTLTVGADRTRRRVNSGYALWLYEWNGELKRASVVHRYAAGGSGADWRCRNLQARYAALRFILRRIESGG